MVIFHRSYIFCLLINNDIRKKTFGFQKNYTEFEKKFQNKVVYLKNIYKFTLEHFLIGHVVFVLIEKNVFKNEKFHFVPNPCGMRKKCLKTKLFDLKRSTNLVLTIFSLETSFLLFIKNIFIKIKNSIFPPKYTGYGKNVKKQNSLFQKHLQLLILFHMSYIFCFRAQSARFTYIGAQRWTRGP